MYKRPILFSLVWLSTFTFARTSFTDYNDVQSVLASLTDTLPPELKSSDLSTRPKAWQEWVTAHDRDIRRRLLRGDEDTVVNWLLFGTSFTQQPKVFFEVSAPLDNLRRLISSRTKDLISALAAADTN